MRTYLKAQTASLIASGVDFAIMLLCVELFDIWYIFGSVTGSISGACTHFLLGRKWVFDARQGRVSLQMARYLAVWTGHIILSNIGIYLLTNFVRVYYAASKVIVAVVMGLSYSYLLQRKYVFSK